MKINFLIRKIINCLAPSAHIHFISVFIVFFKATQSYSTCSYILGGKTFHGSLLNYVAIPIFFFLILFNFLSLLWTGTSEKKIAFSSVILPCSYYNRSLYCWSALHVMEWHPGCLGASANTLKQALSVGRRPPGCSSELLARQYPKSSKKTCYVFR